MHITIPTMHNDIMHYYMHVHAHALLTFSWQDVDHSRRETCFNNKLSKFHGRQWSDLNKEIP